MLCKIIKYPKYIYEYKCKNTHSDYYANVTILYVTFIAFIKNISYIIKKVVVIIKLKQYTISHIISSIQINL